MEIIIYMNICTALDTFNNENNETVEHLVRKKKIKKCIMI